MNTLKKEYTVKIPNKLIESSFGSFCEAVAFLNKKKRAFGKEHVVYNLFRGDKMVVSYQGKFDHKKYAGKAPCFKMQDTCTCNN